MFSLADTSPNATSLATSNAAGDALTAFLKLVGVNTAQLSQSNRLIKLQTTLSAQYGDDILLVQSVDGSETLSHGFDYTLTCISASATLPLKELIGSVARFEVLQPDGVYLPVSGVVQRFSQSGSDGGLAFYQLHLVSWFQVLDHTRASRMFQDMNVVEIVESIFKSAQTSYGDLPVQYALQLLADYPKRSYCCQYRESDYAFVQRLLAEEGIHWHVVQADDGHKLVFADHNDAFEADYQHQHGQALSALYAAQNLMLGALQTRPGLRFHRTGATEAVDGITEFSATRSMVANSTSLVSWDYQQNRTLTAQSTSAAKQGKKVAELAADTLLQDYDHSGMYAWADAEQGERYARILREAAECSIKTFTARGNVRSLFAGRWFELLEHPLVEAKSDELQRQFIVTQSRVYGLNNLPAQLLKAGKTAAQDSTEPSEDGIWELSLSAQRRDIPYRASLIDATGARLNPKPTVRGMQSAVVSGPAGEEIYTDRLGRVKVAFHWNNQTAEQNKAETASCWLRVASPMAGGNFGAQFVPRIGQELLVGFLGGDVDRPVALWRVYNGTNQPAWHDPGVLSGVKSKEHKGSGYNQLVMDDSANEERVSAHSTHGQSELNLGHIITQTDNQRQEARGQGLDLRSDHWGALRAESGLAITTENGSDTAAQYTVSQTANANSQAVNLLHSLSDTAKAQQSSDHPALSAAQTLAKNITGVTTPIAQPSAATLTLHSQADTHLASAANSHSSTGANLLHAATGSINVGVGGQMNVSAMKNMSLFSVSGDIQIDTGKGSTQVQAQGNAMDVLSEKEFKIAGNAKITVGAAKSITIISQGGAYVRIAGSIEIGAPGGINLLSSSRAISGAGGGGVGLPTFGRTNICVECMIKAGKSSAGFVVKG